MALLTKAAMLAGLAATLFMLGVIWFVQVVHYPLFGRVDPAAFRHYHAGHTRATGFVVLGPMICELATAALLAWRRPDGCPPWLAALGLAFALATWGLTFALSVPEHRRLALGFDPGSHRALVATNWLRSAAWTGHAAVMLGMVGRSLR